MELAAIEYQKISQKLKGLKHCGILWSETTDEVVLLGDDRFKAALRSILPALKDAK